MIRIGLTRWFVRAIRLPKNGGQVVFRLDLVPQAKTYRVSADVSHGLSTRVETRLVSQEAISASGCHLAYDMRANAEVLAWRQLAMEIASAAVNKCLQNGLVMSGGFDKAEADYGVFGALMRAVESGVSDADDQVDFIDLVPDMHAMRTERHARQQEARRIEDEANRAHREEQQRHQALFKQHSDAAGAASMDLLRSYLNDKEKKELAERGKVTVRNFMGEFVVPVIAHGLIRHYVEGEYYASYCVVFKDWTIPFGDEALMKIMLLKADPKRLIKTAAKRRENLARKNL